MWHLYPNGGIPKQFVAVDGSVYEKNAYNKRQYAKSYL